ncbi:PCRF domain-containing protein [Argonema galeatum]|uniref:PCRF domain-containing protein n=1 Tax=Argonema galeatum TaxID=2942762 RepID=UPI0020124F40|nr:PCRF domain-containing protein [Argonema galeatum A003/A1]
MEVLDIKREVETLSQRLGQIRDYLNSPALSAKIKQLEQWFAQTESGNDRTLPHHKLQEFENLESDLQQYAQWQTNLEDIKAASELLELEADEELRQETETKITQLNCFLEQFELHLLMSEPFDQNGAFLIVNAEADETDTQDWVEMLLRMYGGWGQKQGYKLHIVDEKGRDYGGIKSATLEISGRYAYGYLKAETGRHRLERISPFNPNSKRPTSFARVEVIPILDDSVDLEIPERDMEIIMYRWDGQNMNKIDTSVRIVHIPTGIAVGSTQERTQLQNKEKALVLIKSRLFAIALSQGVKTIADIRREEIAAIATNTIRHYVFHPYQMVKDLRTGVETTAVAEVINGELDLFLKAYIRHQNQPIHDRIPLTPQ